jgi:hypothetical protein
MAELHKPRFNRSVYEAYGFGKLIKEAEAMGVKADEEPAPEDKDQGDEEDSSEDEGQVDLGDLLGAGGEGEAPAEPAPETQTPAPAPADDEAAKEAEKAEERELHGKISNILSEVADLLPVETAEYRQLVAERTFDYLKSQDAIPMDEVITLLQQMPEVGAKMIQSSAKENFISKDMVCLVAVMESSVDIINKLRPAQADENEVPAEDETAAEEPAETEE